jgi:hypothetical protein
MFALGAIVSLCYVPGLTGAFIATQWPVLSILLPFSLWRSGPVTIFHWLGLLFIAYGAARLSYTPIFNDGIFSLWPFCILGLSFWLGSTLNDLRGLYAGLAVGASVSSVLAVFQAFGYQGVPYVSISPAGIYANGVAQGIVLSLIVVALVSERMWLWVPLLLPGIVLCGSRGAWLALAVGLISTYVRSAWVLVIVVLAGLFFSSQISASDELRLLIWRTAASHLTWLGWGPGAFFSWLIEYQGTPIYPEYAHNDALQLAAEYGIAAALPIGIFAFLLTRTAEREWPVIVTFAAASCYSMPLWVPTASFLVFVAAGRIVRGWAVAWDCGDNRRFDFVPREHRRRSAPSGDVVPVFAGN